MSLRIEDDELRRKRQDDFGMNVGQVTMPQPNGNVPGGEGTFSFSDKYGTDSVFGVDPDQVQAPTFQTSGSQAGSSAGTSLLPQDNAGGSGTFNLTDAVQMDNLPVAITATPTQAPELSSALTATGNPERDGAQGGATDGNGNNGAHPDFGAGDVMNLTGGGLTSADSRFSLSPELPAFGAPPSVDGSTAGAPNADGVGDTPDIPSGGNPDNVDDPANNGGIKEPDDADNDQGDGATGQDGTAKTPEQLAQEEAERQAQIQQQKLLEQQRQEELLKQQQGG